MDSVLIQKSSTQRLINTVDVPHSPLPGALLQCGGKQQSNKQERLDLYYNEWGDYINSHPSDMTTCLAFTATIPVKEHQRNRCHQSSWL